MVSLSFRDFAIGDFFVVVEEISLSVLPKYQVVYSRLNRIPKGVAGIVSGTTKEYMKVDIPELGEYLFTDIEARSIKKDSSSRYISHDTSFEVDD